MGLDRISLLPCIDRSGFRYRRRSWHRLRSFHDAILAARAGITVNDGFSKVQVPVDWGCRWGNRTINCFDVSVSGAKQIPLTREGLSLRD
jgi:hypothetical protein